MNRLEELEQRAHDEGLNVDYVPFNSPRIKGLYCDGSVAIRRDLPTTEKSCVMAEELGHYYTSTGDILNICDVANQKQEHRARMWGYDDRIGLLGLVRAFEAGCRTCYEMAAYLDVTEQYLSEALEAYRRKHGYYTQLNNYVLFFEPHFSIMRKLVPDTENF